MLVVHHLENSRSQRVLRLLEALDVPAGVWHYRRDPALMAHPDRIPAGTAWRSAVANAAPLELG